MHVGCACKDTTQRLSQRRHTTALPALELARVLELARDERLACKTTLPEIQRLSQHQWQVRLLPLPKCLQKPNELRNACPGTPHSHAAKATTQCLSQS